MGEIKKKIYDILKEDRDVLLSDIVEIDEYGIPPKELVIAFLHLATEKNLSLYNVESLGDLLISLD